MTDEQLIIQIAQIKALQAVTLHFLRMDAESRLEAAGNDSSIVTAKIQELVSALEIQYEEDLRSDLGLEHRQPSSETPSRPGVFDWPDVLDSIGNDEP